MVKFRSLLQPVEDFYAESVGHAARFGAPLGFQNAARMMLSSQIGVLVGYLSRRVLGQYDIALLGDEPANGAASCSSSSPTCARSRTHWAYRQTSCGAGSRCTRRRTPTSSSCTRGCGTYLNASLRQYLKLLIDDMRGRERREHLADRMVNRFVVNLRQGHNVVNALMTPQQRELMSRLQALMSLAEGYSNHVMNHVGQELLPNFDLIHQRVEHRQRDRSQVEQLFLQDHGAVAEDGAVPPRRALRRRRGRERDNRFANRAWHSAGGLANARPKSGTLSAGYGGWRRRRSGEGRDAVHCRRPTRPSQFHRPVRHARSAGRGVRE